MVSDVVPINLLEECVLTCHEQADVAGSKKDSTLAWKSPPQKKNIKDCICIRNTIIQGRSAMQWISDQHWSIDSRLDVAFAVDCIASFGIGLSHFHRSWGHSCPRWSFWLIWNCSSQAMKQNAASMCKLWHHREASFRIPLNFQIICWLYVDYIMYNV